MAFITNVSRNEPTAPAADERTMSTTSSTAASLLRKVYASTRLSIFKGFSGPEPFILVTLWPCSVPCC